MLLIIELLFIVILTMILFLLYRYEKGTLKIALPKAMVEEYWSTKERRQHIRFGHELAVTYVPMKRPHLKNNGRSIDISEGGMKLLLDEKLSKGTIVDLTVELPHTKKTAQIEGEVVWAQEATDVEPDPSGKRLFHAGIKFRAINEPSGWHIVDYIRSVAAKI